MQAILSEVDGIPVTFVRAASQNTWGVDGGLHDTSCEGVVCHIMQGSMESCINHFQNPESGASANFGVGLDGRIVQFVALFGNSPFANGAGRDLEPYMSSRVRNLTVEHNWVSQNKWTWSIEHEGLSGAPLVGPQFESSTRLCAYLLGSLPQERRRIFGHNEFDGKNKVNCPGWSRQTWERYQMRVDDLLAGKTAPQLDLVELKRLLDVAYDNTWEIQGRQAAIGAALSRVYEEIRKVHPDF